MQMVQWCQFLWPLCWDFCIHFKSNLAFFEHSSSSLVESISRLDSHTVFHLLLGWGISSLTCSGNCSLKFAKMSRISNLWKIRQSSWSEWNSIQVNLLNIHNIKLWKRGQKKLIGPSWLWMCHLMGRFHNTKHSQKVKQTSVPGINFQRYLRKVQHFHILHLRRQYVAFIYLPLN